MSKYFRRIFEWVKAWQYEGEPASEFPDWIQKLSAESDGWAWLVESYGDTIYFANHEMQVGEWIVSSVDGVCVMSDNAFRATYITEGNA